MGKEDEIRLIANSIREVEGCINGCDCEHWGEFKLRPGMCRHQA